MNTAAYVDQKIAELKAGGIPLSEAAWEAAKLCVGWPYTFGARGKKVEKDGITVRTFDCRGFTYWILLQIFGWELMGTGCTSQWNDEKNWREKGTVEGGIPENTIVCLFYYKKNDKGQRTSTLEHTGFYYNGETCECSKGVQYSKTLNKKWEVWGVPACVTGDVPAPVPPAPGTDKPTLRRGSSGVYVTLMQTELIQHGYPCGPTGADGQFGANTEKALKAFQAAVGLTVDGVCGPKTWAALESPQIHTFTVHIPQLPLYEAEAIVGQYPGAWMDKEGSDA